MLEIKYQRDLKNQEFYILLDPKTHLYTRKNYRYQHMIHIFDYKTTIVNLQHQKLFNAGLWRIQLIPLHLRLILPQHNFFTSNQY